MNRAPSPLGLLRGEKVPKADEGGCAIERHGVLNLCEVLQVCNVFARVKRPLIPLRHLLPHKSVGEKALDWRVVLTTSDLLAPRSIGRVALTTPDLLARRSIGRVALTTPDLPAPHS